MNSQVNAPRRRCSFPSERSETDNTNVHSADASAHAGNVIDLMAALKQSLEKKQPGRKKS